MTKQLSLNNEEVKVKRPIQYVKGNLKIVEWENKDFSSFKIEKFFKDEEDEWKTINTFNYSDLVNMVFLINEFISNKKPLIIKE